MNLETAKETGGQSFESFYVASSRGKDKLLILTDSIEKLKQQVNKEQEKKIARDYEPQQTQETKRAFEMAI